MKRIIPVLLLSCLLAPLLYSADSRELTLEQALETAFQENAALITAGFDIAAARAGVSEAEAARFPSLSLSGSYTRNSEEESGSISLPATGPLPAGEISLSPVITNRYSLALEFQQPLFTGFGISAGIEQAETLLQQSRARYKLSKAEVAWQVKQAYWNLVRAREVETVVRENVEQVKARLEEVNNLMQQGLATDNEVLKAEMQLARTELLLTESSNSRILARMQLANLLGLPLEREIIPTEILSADIGQEADVQELLARAMNSRPEIALQSSRIRSGETAESLARSGLYPKIFISGSFLFARPNPKIFPSEDEFADTWEVGIGARIDIGGIPATTAKIRQAETRTQQARKALEQLRDQVRLQVIRSCLELENRLEGIRAGRKLVSQAEENLRGHELQLENGLARTTDVLEAQLELLQARLTLTQNLIDRELALAQLELAIGEGNE